MTVTSCAIRSWWSYLHEFDDAKDKVGAGRIPQKTEVICYIADLDAAPHDLKIDEVRLHASVSTVAAGSSTLGVAVGPVSSSQTSSWPKQTSFEQCTNEFSCARFLRQNLHSLAKVLALAVSTISSGCMVTQSCNENELLKSSMRLGKGLS